MSSILLRNGKKIADYCTPYFVAEVNTSHFGDMSIARSMIEQAKECGCDCVKFQSWSAETLYCNSYYKENAIAKRIVTKFSLKEQQLKELAGYCGEIGIDFSSTPYSREEAEFLANSCQAPFLKIASMELNNTPYLAFLGRLGIPLILSTGMGTLEEIIHAVRAIEASGNTQIAILHCVSLYPTDSKESRLHNILGLRMEFSNYPIGYSDHSIGIEIPLAAVALGACVIEKHFTLDRTKIGMDNQMAMEPHSMKEMISACKKVQTAMGGAGRLLAEVEKAQIPKMRRSLVAKRALSAGHVITLEDLDAKRPGTGIGPNQQSEIIGKKVKVNLGSGEIINPQIIED
jgi:N-acetylneuraminate synthase